MKKLLNSIRLITDKSGVAIPLFMLLLLFAISIFSFTFSNKSINKTVSPDTIASNEAVVTSNSAGSVLAGSANCGKLGINYAVEVGAVDSGSVQRAANLGMKHAVYMVTSGGQLTETKAKFKEALDLGITPILRMCYTGNCSLTNPDEYANFINTLANSSEVGGRTFYAIAGPNEPLSENYLGNTIGDPVSTAQVVTPFMNTVISNVNASNVRLISPAFNSTNGNYNSLIQEMKNRGANFSALDAITINAYNLFGTTRISSFVSNTKTLFPGQQLVLTEIGMFESERNPSDGQNVPHQQAMGNLSEEIALLRSDGSILSYNLFNSFGNNGSSDFAYNVMSDDEIRTVNGQECSDVDIVPFPTSPGGGTGNPPGGATSCDSNASYCEGNEISFEDYDSGCRADREEICDPPGGWNWYQDGAIGGACGDYAQDPVDGNPQTVCRVPEIRGFSPQGDQQCGENLTTHGDRSMKMFTAFSSINAGTCYDLGANFPGGSAGFDVRVKEEIEPAYGEVKVMLGTTNQNFQAVDWTQVNWGTVETIGTSSYGPDRFATRSLTINIPAGTKTVCTRINSQYAGVGISSFWDGGFIAESGTQCNTASGTSDDDGVDRRGGGQCVCGENGSEPPGGPYNQDDPVNIDYDYAYANSMGWNGGACEIRSISNGAPSEYGQLFVGLDMNKCSENKNFEYTCSDPNNWTAGYAWTACLKEFPLLNYLAASEGTEENNFITDCELDAFRIFSPDEQINFTNEFPGMAQLVGGDGLRVNMKVPRLGGAAACWFINWDDFYTDLQISPQLVGELHLTGGYAAPDNDDGFVALLLNFLKQSFTEPTISESTSNEVTLHEPVCNSLPGGPVTKVNISDTALFNFAIDEGKCEALIEAGNYELTPNEVCDTQWIYDQEPRKTGQIVGASCKLSSYDRTFEWEDYKDDKTLDDANILNRISVFPTPLPGATPVPGTEVCQEAVICGEQFNCYSKMVDLYRACRFTAGGEVEEVGDSPFVRWERTQPWENISIKGLDRATASAWRHEFTNSPLGIVHENVGIEIPVCISVYDLQQPDLSPEEKRERLVPLEDYLARTTLADGGGAYPYDNIAYDIPTSSVLGDQSGSSALGSTVSEQNDNTFQSGTIIIDDDPLIQYIRELAEDPNNHLLDYVNADPLEYNPLYLERFALANVRSRESSTDDGASQVCFLAYYPYVGQIPRIYERISYFLSNQNDEDPSRPYERLDYFGNQSGGASQSLYNQENIDEILAQAETNTDTDGSGGGEVKGIFAAFYAWVAELADLAFEYVFIPPVNIGEDFSLDCGRLNCDHFSSPDEPYFDQDPFTLYLSSEGLLPEFTDIIGGSGSGQQCTPGGAPGSVNKLGLAAPVKDAWGLNQCYGPTKNPRTTFNPPPAAAFDSYDELLWDRCFTELNPALGATGTDYGSDFRYFHSGLDIGPRPAGTSIPIYSAGEGSVYLTKSSTTGYGNQIIIKHTSPEGETFYTRYGHLASFSVGVGDTVDNDTQIGMMGTTGNSTGIHLHFEVITCLDYVEACMDDPTSVFFDIGDSGTGSTNNNIQGASTSVLATAYHDDVVDSLPYALEQEAEIGDYDPHFPEDHKQDDVDPAEQKELQVELDEREKSILGIDDLNIVTRAEWGADESLMTWEPVFYDPQRIVLHHTVTDLAPSDNGDYANVVNRIYQSHLVRFAGNGTSGDIGYHYLIDPNGVIYQGRKGGDGASGAHVRLNNPGSIGIAMIGNFTNRTPSQAALNSLELLLSVKTQEHDIPFVWNEGIFGHRDFRAEISDHPDPSCRLINATECPGTSYYEWMEANIPGDGPGPDINTIYYQGDSCYYDGQGDPPVGDGDDRGDSGDTSTSSNSCEYTPPTDGSEKDLECLIIKTANFINTSDEYGARIPWEFMWAIMYQETRHRCTPTHVQWGQTLGSAVESTLGTAPGGIPVYTYTDKCTGNPAEVGMHMDGNTIAPQVRGVTQFSAGTFDRVASNTYWESAIYGVNMPSNTEAILDQCVNYLLGEDASTIRYESRERAFTPSGILNSYRPDDFSRARVADSLCASMLMLSDLAGAANGSYVPPQNWGYQQVRDAAGPYHGLCEYDYGSGTQYYCDDVWSYMQLAQSEFANINCEE
ncbi:peptidoglycan DD-metalloendopeptidase family protein [Candidatus Dojkabacteria bacterium]|uniref:Peptidoglycan DD-metalloendopeptidase family protein n=1 Tax=Candidatus Dojkabacteria bacterium TaxID=2099670 RepID=A0A955L4W5_9BACT|nr:peptidoglycan DD-metalloendopeptidase family protein [Candidatus Dojkabacteria bacterium]